MINTTKFNASDAQIRSAFMAGGLGEITEITELSEGWFNRIYSAKSIDGKKYVIKFAPPKDAPILTYETNTLLSEINCYKLLQANTSIKTPKIIFSDFSLEVLPTSYFIMEFIDAKQLSKVSLNSKEKAKVADRIAWILAQFHSIEGSGFGYEQLGLKPTYREGLVYMTELLISDCARFNKQCDIGKKLLKYINIFADSIENVPCTLVNYDLNNLNIFYNKLDNGDIELTVIDLERCLFGDPVCDFVIQETAKPLASKSIITLYNNYAKQRIECTHEEEIRLQLMSAYLAVIMYSERFSRFRGFSKYFNPVYISGTLTYKVIGKLAFARLKRLIDG